MLEEAGFEAVNAQDRTEQFTAILQSELETFTGMKEEFLKVTVWVSPTTSCGTTWVLGSSLYYCTKANMLHIL